LTRSSIKGKLVAAAALGTTLFCGYTVTAAAQHVHGQAADSLGTAPVGIVNLSRAVSGTAWQPGAAAQPGHHVTAGAWNLMLHGTAFIQYNRQFGVRAAEQLGSTNWLMLMADRAAGTGMLRLRAMASADVLTVTARGYPQLLQAAQPYHGQTVTDRQHPHELLMELSASFDQPLDDNAGFSFYVAPVGEPALGPVSFSHRPSAASEPGAPLGHHNQDFTHTSFGVATLGLFTRSLKIEGSLFNGWHPDDERTGFDRIRLNSAAGRISMSPSPRWVMAAWYGHLAASTGTHAHAAVDRIGASLLYTLPRGNGSEWSTALIYGADLAAGGAPPLHTVLLETRVALGQANVLFGRVEALRRSAGDLALTGSVSRTVRIGAVSAGYSRTLPALHLMGPLEAAAGARGTINLVPGELDRFYGTTPLGGIVYLQLRFRR
jgi:hypothetical protein